MMLSTGSWYKEVPTEPDENVAWRVDLYRRAAGNRKLQRALLTMCERDIFFYANAFVWQYNPAYVGDEIGPMIAYDFQREAVAATLEHFYAHDEHDFPSRNDMVWEKSRELGATWWALIMFDWGGLFHRDKKFFAISHSEDAVDRPADSDTLFWKVNFMHENTPRWLRRGVKKRRLGFEYPATNSLFNGAATTERSGVGGRATGVLLDEFSKHRADRDIWGQTANTGPRLVIGTHYGIAGKFFELTQEPEQAKIVMHWSQHPVFGRGLYKYDRETNKVEILDKAYEFPPQYKFVVNGSPNGGPFPCVRSPWYDHECVRRKSERDVAMHLDINPQGSVSQFFNPATVLRLIREHCRSPMWEGLLDYDRATGEFRKLETIPGGPLKLWLLPDHRGRLPMGRYTVGCDVSTGMGSSPSCLSGMDCLRGQKIADFTNAHIDEINLAPLAVALCQLLWDHDKNGAFLIWEIPGPGQKFGKAVIDLGYRNIYYRERDDVVSREVTEKVGWANTKRASLAMLAEYRDAIFSGKLTNYSEDAMRECLSFFVDKDGYPKHGAEKASGDPNQARINHGDHVMADAMMWLAGKPFAQQEKKKEETEVRVGTLAWRMQYHDNLRSQRQTSGHLLARGCGRR